MSAPTATGSVAPQVYEGGLRQTLATRHVMMISLGGIIGAGLFVGSSAVIAAAGPGVVVSYALAGALVFFVMRMLGELAVAQPGVGSFTEYTRKPLGSFAAFATGWLYAYFWIIVVAVEALVGAEMLQSLVPVPTWLIALVLLAALTAVNLFSVRAYGEFEFWFASIKVVAVIAFIAAGLIWLFGLGHLAEAPALGLFSLEAFVPRGPASLLAAVPAVIFSLCGAEIAAIAAAESSEPSKNVSRIAVSVIVRVLLFYLGSAIVIVAIVPWTDVTPGASPFVAALERMQAPYARPLMGFVIFTAVMSCLNSGIYVASRVLLGLSLKGDAPQRMMRANARGVPVGAILFTAAVAFAILLLSSASYEGLFTFLLNASGAVMLLVYLMIAAAHVRSRLTLGAAARDLPVRMWLFPGLTLVVMGAMAGILVAMLFLPEMKSQVYATGAALLVLVISFAGSRAWLRRQSRRADVSDPPVPTTP